MYIHNRLAIIFFLAGWLNVYYNLESRNFEYARWLFMMGLIYYAIHVILREIRKDK